MSLINLQLARIGLVGSSPDVPEIEGIVLWDDPDDDGNGNGGGPFEPTAGDRDLPITGGNRGDGILPPSGSSSGGSSSGTKSRETRPHLFEQEYIPFGHNPDRDLPPWQNEGGLGGRGSGGGVGSGGPGGDYYPRVPNPNVDIIPPEEENWHSGISSINQSAFRGPEDFPGLPVEEFTIHDIVYLTRLIDGIWRNGNVIYWLEEIGIDPSLVSLLLRERIQIVMLDPCPPATMGHAAIARASRATNLQDGIIYLCPEFWELTPAEQASALLHEILHSLGYSEIDSYIMEFLVGYVDGFHSGEKPLLQYNSNSDAAIAFWCSVLRDTKRKPSMSIISTRDDNGHTVLVSKGFLIDFTENGNVYVREGNAYLGNVGDLLPPGDFWDQTPPHDVCDP